MPHATDAITISISPEQIIAAVKGMKKAQRDAFIEDLLAAVSPTYIDVFGKPGKIMSRGASIPTKRCSIEMVCHLMAKICLSAALRAGL